MRFFYLLLQSGDYRDRMLLDEKSLATDWFYLVKKFKWSVLMKTGCLESLIFVAGFHPPLTHHSMSEAFWAVFQNPGWAPIFFATWALLSMDMQTRHKGHVWTDCPELPNLGRVRKSDELHENENSDEANE